MGFPRQREGRHPQLRDERRPPHGVRRQLGEGDHLGLGSSKPATCFPTAGTVASSWDPALAEEMGKALGNEAHDLDVNVLLGPGLNIKRNPLCGRNFEYYSEDPIVAGRMAAGLIRGIQSNGVSACPKHFAVNSQELRRQASNSVVDERTMREIYLTAFEIAVREAAPMTIMTSYNEINGVYAHENKHLLQDILRNEWGFDGMVVSDWGGSNSAVAAVKAGGSLEMPSPGYTSVRELEGAVKAGTLSEADLNARAAEVAKIAHLTKTEGVGRNDLLKDAVAAAHHEIARKVAENSSVLLKNASATLPLQSGTRVAVIGDMSKTPRFQGSGSPKVNATREENILDELKNAAATTGVTVAGYAQGYDRQGAKNQTLIDEATTLAAADTTDAVIVVVGLDERSESEGLDRSTMAIPQVQNDLVDALTATGKPVIIVLVGGFLTFLFAEVIAQAVNFFVQMKWVFKSDSSFKDAAWKYAILAVVVVVVNLVLPGYVTSLCQGWGMNAGVAGTIASVVNTLLAVIVSYPLLKFWIMPKNK